MEEAGLASAVRPADARPELPGPVGRLPDREVDRLLVRGADLAEVRVPGHDPTFFLDAGDQRLVVGAGESGEQGGDETDHRDLSSTGRSAASSRLAL